MRNMLNSEVDAEVEKFAVTAFDGLGFFNIF